MPRKPRKPKPKPNKTYSVRPRKSGGFLTCTDVCCQTTDGTPISQLIQEGKPIPEILARL